MKLYFRPSLKDRPELIGRLKRIEPEKISDDPVDVCPSNEDLIFPLHRERLIGKLKRLEPDKIYCGPRDIYPSDVDQIIEVQGLRMPFDLIVHPGTNPIFPYEGEYVVLPDDDEQQVLPTEGKTLFEDVIVEPIPYREVGNPVGGYTITIGT